MEFVDEETKWRHIENAFIIFMITVSELGLSSEAGALCIWPHAMKLNDFIERQREKLEVPVGIRLL